MLPVTETPISETLNQPVLGFLLGQIPLYSQFTREHCVRSEFDRHGVFVLRRLLRYVIVPSRVCSAMRSSGARASTPTM